MRFAVATLALLLPLGATTLEQLSLDQMIAKSSLIVRGKVSESHAVRRGSMIYTAYRVDVAEQLKGDRASSIEVLIPGGTLQGTRQSFAGTPRLESGGNYAVFVWTSKSGVNYIIGLSQGLFDVKTAASGELQLRRGAIESRVVDSTGKSVSGEAVSLTWKSLRDRVSAQLGRSVEK